MSSLKAVDRAVAFRLGQLHEREEKIASQLALLQLQLKEVQRDKRELLVLNALENHQGSIITEPNQPYPVGTVLDEQGRPVEEQEAKENK